MKLDIPGNERSSLKTAAIVSAALMLPFVVLESVNSPNAVTGLPVVLFVFMWVLAFAFVAILIPLPRNLHVNRWTAPHVVGVLSRIAVLALLGFMWVSVTADQMPCFLGVPNCD